MPLNKAAIRPKYEMPNLDELLPKLNKAIVFSTLDRKMVFTRFDWMKAAVLKPLSGFLLAAIQVPEVTI